MSLDFRYAWRSLRGSPVTTLTIVLLLALGIASTTTIFSVIDALLLRSLPVQHPEELVELNGVGSLRYDDFSWEECQQLLDRKPAALSQLTCDGSIYVTVTNSDHLERRRVGVVPENYFSFLGVAPIMGHLPSPDQPAGSEDQSAILSYVFWQEWFAQDPSALGRTLMIHGHPFVISAVLPRGFNGVQPDTGPDVRITWRGDQALHDPEAYPSGQIVGRLQPGASLNAARDQVQTIWKDATPSERRGAQTDPLEFVRIGTGSSLLRDQFGKALLLLMYGVASLLLIVCANVAGLLLARAASRSRESAVRIAVGASTRQLLRGIFAESSILIVAGGLLGIGLTYAILPGALHAMPPMRDRAAILHPLRLEITPDLRVLAFTLATCGLTALLFALAPAYETTRVNAHDALKSARSTLRSSKARGALVSIQVALCTILLLGAGLLVRTLTTLRDLNPGFDTQHVVTFSLDPRMSGHTPESGVALEQRLLEQVQQLPGVQSVSYAGRALMRGTGIKGTIAPEGVLTPPGGSLNSSLNAVSIGYFDTMGMRMLAGRAFRTTDVPPAPLPAGSPLVDVIGEPVVVNQAFVQAFFPNVDPINKRFGTAGKPSFQIIGVVTDAKYRSLREKSPPIYYMHLERDPRGYILHVRTSSDPGALIPTVQGILQSLDPRLPFYETHTLKEEVDASLWQDRLVAWLASIFGAMAALLAGVGLYGMLAYNVAQRRREIGIRISLGAPLQSIVSLISWQALIPVITGLIAGVAGFAVTAKYIASLLYGVTPWDPPALTAAVSFVLLTAATAVAIPALQATQVNPATALRDDT